MKKHLRKAIGGLFEKAPAETRSPETISLSLARMEERQVLSANGGEVMLFSVGGAGLDLPNGQHADADDVVQYDGTDFEILFDGNSIQDGGIGNIDALAYIGDNQFLFSFATETTIDGVTYGHSDIVLFQADSLGEGTTSGQFSLFFAGASLDLDLDTPIGNIDAVDLLDDGTLIISTEGDVPIDIKTFRDEDLIAITPDAAGNYTPENVSLYFQGNDVGLNQSFNSEDINAVSVDGDLIRLSTFSSSAVLGNVYGSGDDVLSFTATSLGENTDGTFALIFDGSVEMMGARFSLNALDFAELTNPTNPPTAGNLDVVIDEDVWTDLQLVGDDGDADLDQPLTYVIVDGPAHGVITNFDATTGTFTYVPNANYNGTDSFTYMVQDLDADGVALTSEVATVNLTINAVNDAPTVHIPQEIINGDQGNSVVIQGVSVGDIEAEAESTNVTVVLSAQEGVLSVGDGSSPVQISGNGTSEITLSGTVADINALLASGLTFTPAADFFGQTTVEVTIQDHDPGTPLEASGSVQIEVAQAPADPAETDPVGAFQERITELVESGELRSGIARSLLNSIRGGRVSRINLAMYRIGWLSRVGHLDADVADELTGYLQGLKEDILAEQGNDPGSARSIDARFCGFTQRSMGGRFGRLAHR